MAALRTGSKCIAHPAKGRDSAFSPFRAPDSRDFAKLNLLFLNPNLIFEIGSYQIHACEFHFKNNVTECDKSFL